MSKPPDNAKDFLAGIPQHQKNLEARYREFLERLQALSPEMVQRHLENAAIEDAYKDNLDALWADIMRKS